MFTSWFGPSKATLRAEIARLIDERNKAQLQVELEKRTDRDRMQAEVQVQIIKMLADKEKKELKNEMANIEARHQKELEQTRMKMLMLCTSDDPATKEAIIAYKNRAMQIALIETLALDDGSGVKKDGL